MSKTVFQRVEPVSKKARVVASLREAILSGAIQSGEQIVEGKIAQHAGNPAEAARVAREFLMRMKDNLGSKLLPTSSR